MIPRLFLLTVTFTLLTLLTFLPRTTTAYEGGPELFCKCICGSNYTIIPLGERPEPPPNSEGGVSPQLEFELLRSREEGVVAVDLDAREDNDSGKGKDGDGKAPGGKNSCSDCNRQFCLSYRLPICKNIKNEEEVVTMCFQRDSRKDQAVVYIFIITTVGLLGYAVVRPWVGGCPDAWKARRAYVPLAGGVQ